MSVRSILIIVAFSMPLALGLGLILEKAGPGLPSWLNGWLGGAMAVPMTHVLVLLTGGRFE